MMDLLKNRIDDISRLISEIASGNFDYKIEHSNQDDELDAIIAGINMLGEELKSSTVSRDYMDSLFKGVVDMLIVLNTDFTIQSTNQSVTQLLYFDPSETQGKHLKDFLSEGSAALADKIMADLEANGHIANIELDLKTKQQKAIPASCSFSMLYNNQKRVSGILIIAKDITPQKKAEEELRRAKDQAEAANRAKSRFLASMSHEIRTPLNGILGITEILLSDPLTDQQRDYLKMVLSSGQTLTKLLNDILDLNKIETGKLTLENIPFNFEELMTSNIHPYKYIASQKGLGFNYRFDKNIPKVLVGDPTRINQVLVNLISNAIKFTEKGAVDVEFSLESISEDQIILGGSVTDSGIGIPIEKQEIIFKSFAQSDNSMTRRYGGSGLGLAITKYLVELMGGVITVKSPPDEVLNRGTTFFFNLKLKHATQEECKVVESKNRVENLTLDKSVRILVVDDNELNLLVAERMIKNFGAQVKVAENGQRAIDMAKSEDFDMILMDVQMPVLDGYKATRELRKSNYKKPILALSAGVFKDDIQKCFESGMNGHIQKPFSKKEIYQRIKEWIP